MTPSPEQEDIEIRAKLADQQAHAILDRLLEALKPAEGLHEMIRAAEPVLSEHDPDALRNVWLRIDSLWSMKRDIDGRTEYDDQNFEQLKALVFGVYRSKVGGTTDEVWEALTGQKPPTGDPDQRFKKPSPEAPQEVTEGKLWEHKTKTIMRRLIEAVYDAEGKGEQELALRAAYVLFEHDPDTLRDVFIGISNTWDSMERELDTWSDANEQVFRKARGLVLGAYCRNTGLTKEEAWEALTGTKMTMEGEEENTP